MTDAHCHVTGGDPSVRELLIGRDFVGIHPWEAEALPAGELAGRDAANAAALAADPSLGVGEIGLDRLRSRIIPSVQRALFERQLARAFELGRTVVLHGAKCWGQVVAAVEKLQGRGRGGHGGASPVLFHGFSRSDGLIPAIVALGGYISVGPAVLNDHAVNYRALVGKVPLERLLVETDRTPENAAACPAVTDVARKVAEIRGLPLDELERRLDANSDAFATCRTPSA